MEVTEYIARARQGDQAAFTQLLDRYWPEVYNFMLKRSGNETDAEDITIETFSKAFEKLDQYNPQFQFNTWLIAIAKNVHVDMIRKRNATHALDLTDEDRQARNIADSAPSAEDELIRQQHLAYLLQCIKQLKPHYQEVIQLRYFQELSYPEIADELREPLTNIKVKLLRAKKLLAEIIANSRS